MQPLILAEQTRQGVADFLVGAGNLAKGPYLSIGLPFRKESAGKPAPTVITDRERIREEPPDILLTNYKMLDFLLIRAKDSVLWRDNAPDTLRFLVVDELHSFDGLRPRLPGASAESTFANAAGCAGLCWHLGNAGYGRCCFVAVFCRRCVW